MRNMSMAAKAACCLVALFSGPTMAMAEPACWQAREMEAARVRDLQTMLMLQALKCRTTNVSVYDKYNEFSGKKHDLIISYDNMLKTRYMRERGIVEGEKAYQEFSTKLANSHAALRQSPGSCDMADGLLTLAINASDTELPALARSFTETPIGVGEECVAAAPVAVAEAPQPMPESKPAVETVAATSPAAAPPAAAPSPAAALEAAAIALQSAAASLKAQSAPDPSKPAAAAVTTEKISPVT